MLRGRGVINWTAEGGLSTRVKLLWPIDWAASVSVYLNHW